MRYGNDAGQTAFAICGSAKTAFEYPRKLTDGSLSEADRSSLSRRTGIDGGKIALIPPSAAQGRNQGFEIGMKRPRAVSFQHSALSFRT